MGTEQIGNILGRVGQLGRTKSLQSDGEEKRWDGNIALDGPWARGGYSLRHMDPVICSYAELIGDGQGEHTGHGCILSWWAPEPAGTHGAALRFLVEGGNFVLLNGKRGRGKTAMATSLGLEFDRHLVRKGKSFRDQAYFTLAGLFDQEKATYGEGGHVPVAPLKRARNAAFLVLDEIDEVLFTDRVTPWEVQQFTSLIDARYGSMRATVLITNKDANEFSKLVPESASTRIRGSGKALACDWHSLRDTENAPEQWGPERFRGDVSDE